MQVRRFEASTMLEAVRKVKEEMGKDALILSSRTLRKSRSLFGLFASRKYGTRLQFFGSYEAQLHDEMESHNAGLGIRYRF